ncbi:hypothetical protein ACIQM4_15410 [Streptomyces sp. NPDC091272]|uniref:hypothetical protein n=1 Tax=Streptomyces sp. NPDC091272 TaxID=3365981 RepID=UPI00380DD994
MKRRRGRYATTIAAALAAFLLLVPAGGASGAEPAPKPLVTLSKKEAGKGGEITVRGSGWRPGALLMLLICGEASPAAGVRGGTNSCANADGRAVTTDAKGAFRRVLAVAEPPKPCPCVVHVATVQGQPAVVDAEFKVAGHPVAPLPEPAPDAGRLAVVDRTVRLDGSGSLLTWFGSPQARRVVVEFGNVGSAPVTDPVFQVGTSHGVFAPLWEERQWRGTIAPGKRAEVALDVQLPAGAHGDYLVSVKYGSKLMAAQPWGVDRPWGVVLFWLLLAVVVPAALFRIGMAVVDRVRPGAVARAVRRVPRAPARHRTAARPAGAGGAEGDAEEPARPAGPPATSAGPATTTTTAALPWFTPDTAPGPAAPHAQVSAPHEGTTRSQTPER